MNTCELEWCDRPRTNTKLCPGHYSQLRKTGELKPLRVRRPKGHGKTVSEIRRDSKMRNLYGITGEQYNDMVLAQCGTCQICGQVPDRPLVVDHDHLSGAVRALLCHTCNVGLGHFKDDPDRLSTAIHYLGEHK